MNTQWDPELYLRFQEERTQPSIDLVNRIVLDEPGRILDVGCGPGNSTEILFGRWPEAEITGLDSSEDMIQKAKKSFPKRYWVHSDIMDFQMPGYFDLVFSNAVLQWLPHQKSVIKHLVGFLKPGGILAVQVPQNQGSPLHETLNKIASQKEFSQYTKDAQKTLHYRTGYFYYDKLSSLMDDLYIWETSYYHIMDKHENLIQWYRSTGMRPYLQSLPDDELREKMINLLLAQCRLAYPLQKDGRVIFPFNRLFFIGKKPSK
ncbi:MAG: methyltransferase domain-containing protein [Spirochaetales bacterium]|nr:methyltransferase domain-containing protein [Spirochaetales bacterium]